MYEVDDDFLCLCVGVCQEERQRRHVLTRDKGGLSQESLSIITSKCARATYVSIYKN
uniref:Uncharacterized protein n=1 Tax=Aegilops tauschii subsp. strangulata TaxID=200361 RepID=A0A452XZN6_AEGTS